MELLNPKLPDFDLEDWARKPYAERLRMMCLSWAMDGFGAPPTVYVLYVIKIAFYIGMWVLFVTLTPGIGGPSDIASWWAEPVAFQKAVLWTLMYEGMGLGAGSGPLTARYMPPIGGVLYFLRPGTTRLPAFPRRVPLTAGHRRSWVDVALYALHLTLLVRLLLAPEITPGLVLPTVLLLPLMGLRDKTIFLAHRAEHYWMTAIVFLFPEDLFSGSKAIQLALWWGAASSKLNHHFPSVIAIMVSNSPVLRWRGLLRSMYRDFPTDLRPSRLATWFAHGGTVVEYTFPLILVFGSGGWPTTIALIVMVGFHGFITLCFPLGVPIEWNVFFVYSGLALFGVHADASLFSIGSPLLIAILVTTLVIVPVLGNLRPELISFLPSMRYYAGNWATSLWLFRSDTGLDKLDAGLTKIAPVVQRQLEIFYDERTSKALLGKALAFRAMHLHGRALNDLLPRAVDDLERYEVCDGEWIAGVVIGWNFGDGHLHHEQLLEAVQAQCGFEPGELRCVFLESQPAHRQRLHWRIVDAATGQIEDGQAEVRGLLASQPWPDGDAYLTSS